MKSQRQDQILRCLAEIGSLGVEQAATRFGASVATVRRDFNQLAKANLVQRIRGGIRLTEDGQMRPFAVREVCLSEEKSRIAQKAASLLQAGDVVFVDGGTTTLQLASCLPPFALRIITNSLTFAEALERRALARNRWELFLTGRIPIPKFWPACGAECSIGCSEVPCRLGADVGK